MKTILVAMALVCAGGCHVQRELQAEMVSTQLIRIDTVYRYSGAHVKQQLIWRDSDNLDYVIYVPLNQAYVVGTRMLMIKPR